MLKLILLLLCCFFNDFQAFASENYFNKAKNLFENGKYKATIEELNSLKNSLKDKKDLALTYYWLGITYNKLQDFPEAIQAFKNSIRLGNRPVDIDYELGQAYFASEKMRQAKIYFSESFKKSFKRSTSLYYMAYISKDLGDIDSAKTLFLDVTRLPEEDSINQKQAAWMQIGDIELESVENKPNLFRNLEAIVIPTYEKALSVNKESPLAGRIRKKILDIQKKYNLVLFQLRNGRPTQVPPYFLRAAQELAYDTNVTFAPTETTISKSKQASSFSKTEIFGKYSLYHKDYLSFNPEFRFNNSHYFNRVPEIYRNDNMFFGPALRTTYEYTWNNNPASHLFDYDYSEALRDVNSEEKLVFSSRSHTFMFGEKFKFFSFGETTVRFKLRYLETFTSVSNSQTTSFVFEQVVGLAKSTFLFYSSLDLTKVKNNDFDSNVLTLRADWLLPKYENWFTPSLGLGLTFTDPINNRTDRGLEIQMNPTVRLNRTINKSWNLNGRLEYTSNNSKDKTNFDFKKTLMGLELEYLY